MRPYRARHRHRGGGAFPSSGRAARLFAREELSLLLLSLIVAERRHGYELIRKMKSLSRGAYAPSSGMVYPALADLEGGGLAVHEEADGGRKAYIATERGAAEASSRESEIAELRARLENLPDEANEEPASVRRALANLDMALTHALGDAETGRIDEIVELIDGTARQIERLGR